MVKMKKTERETKKVSKVICGWKLYVDYGKGKGWEHKAFEATYQEYRAKRKAYQKKYKYPQRWHWGSIPNPGYVQRKKKIA